MTVKEINKIIKDKKTEIIYEIIEVLKSKTFISQKPKFSFDFLPLKLKKNGEIAVFKLKKYNGYDYDDEFIEGFLHEKNNYSVSIPAGSMSFEQFNLDELDKIQKLVSKYL